MKTPLTLALLAALIFSADAEGRGIQAIKSLVSNRSCLSSSSQSAFGSVYNGCAGSIGVTMPAVIDSAGTYNMIVGGYGTSTITCYITVTNDVATSYWQSGNQSFWASGINTTQTITTPHSLPGNGAQSVYCSLPSHSYLFTYSY